MTVGSTPRHVLLLRHGTTAASASGAFTGRSDVSLSRDGLAQAARWRPVLDDRTPAAFTSPLRRAADTAVAAGLAAARTDLLLEWDLGSLEGQPADAFRTAHPAWNLFADGVPDGSGESPADVAGRAAGAWELLTGADAEVCVAVSHGQFLKALVAHALGLPSRAAARFSLGPARAGLLTRRANGRFSLTGWNVSPVPPGTSLWSELT